MGSGSGSEPVWTTEPAIFISKNHKNNAQGRKLFENIWRGGTRSSKLLGELQRFLAREHCGGQFL